MTELIWDGKYDKDGKRVAPVRIALPFQTVETVNESGQQRAAARSLWELGQPGEWRNRLIWGDKKYVLPSLLPEFAGKVNLIYIDPPFATGADFSFTTTIPDSDDSFLKEPSMIEEKAYRDTWGRDLDSYLQWFYETAVMLRELLADDESIYVHLDDTMCHYAKVVLDEVFSPDAFRNEVVWKRASVHSDWSQGAQRLGRSHDVNLIYARSESTSINPVFAPYSDEYIGTHYKLIDSDGRLYRLDNILGPGGAANGNPSYEVLGVTRYWRYSKATMERLLDEGRIIQTKPGAVPQYKRYLDEMPGVPIQSVWDDIPPVNSQAQERLNYPTQKPQALLVWCTPLSRQQ